MRKRKWDEKMINLSAEQVWQLHHWMPHDLKAEQIVFFPDACPGKSPLPTGVAVFTKQEDWRKFALSDCGCGMRLVRSSLKKDDLTTDLWDQVAVRIKANKGGLGDLGGGNHFLDALLPYDDDQLWFLIHTGSRKESGLVDDLVDSPARFDAEFKRVIEWAEANRVAIQESLSAVVGPLEFVLDSPHNTFEQMESGVIIRKGSVKLTAGELAILPSHMTGDVVLLRATSRISDVLCSMSHGTGRKMSRSDAKVAARTFNFDEMRSEILMPSFLKKESLNTEGPFAYRDLDDCLALIDGYVEEESRFRVVAYMGHL